MSKCANFWLSKSIFDVNKVSNLSKKNFHLWSTFFVIDIFWQLQCLNHFIFMKPSDLFDNRREFFLSQIRMGGIGMTLRLSTELNEKNKSLDLEKFCSKFHECIYNQLPIYLLNMLPCRCYIWIINSRHLYELYKSHKITRVILSTC